MDPVLGEVYREIPSNADDLTEISGIGTREAVALNRMGVYFFSQIAHWQDRQVAAFASELGMTESAITEKKWVAQARILMSSAAAAVPAAPLLSSGSAEAAVVLAAPVSSPPASATRTLTLLVCALLLGCFAVYAFNGESSAPIVGVLAADTTSLSVPADARLTELNVAPGDEVFTGEILLTLEKTEHLNQIAAQERAVRRLQNDLSEAEQRAKMELKWRGRSLDNELAEIRSRLERIRQVSEEKQRVAAQFSKYEAARVVEEAIKTVSSKKEIGAGRGRVNKLLFINGRSDVLKLKSAATAPPEVEEPRLRPTFDLVQARAEIALLEAEADSLARRGERLEQIRQELPEQVNSTAGVTRLAAQCAMASDTLDSMRREPPRGSAVAVVRDGDSGQLPGRRSDGTRRRTDQDPAHESAVRDCARSDAPTA